MMEKKYQLVAWTENITGKEDARLHMTPSLECDVQADLVTDMTFIHMEEYKFDGPVSLTWQEEQSWHMRRCQDSRYSLVTLAMESDISSSPPSTASGKMTPTGPAGIQA